MLITWIMCLGITGVLCMQKLSSNSVELFDIGNLDRILVNKSDVLVFMNVMQANAQFALKSFTRKGNNMLTMENKSICDDGKVNTPLRLCNGESSTGTKWILQPVESKKDNYMLQNTSGTMCAVTDLIGADEVIVKTGSCSDMNVIHFLVAPMGKFANNKGDLPDNKHEVADKLTHDNRMGSERKLRNFKGNSAADKLDSLKRQEAAILNDYQKKNN